MNNKSLEGRNIRVTVHSGPQINILRRSASPQGGGGGRIKLSYFRHGSVSPPRTTNANYNANNTTTLSQVRCIRRQNSLVIQRKPTTNHSSYDMNFKCQQNTQPTRLVMDIHTSGMTNAGRLKNNQYERSMQNTALTPNTNGSSIAIMIGASNSSTTSNRIVSDNNNNNNKWLNRDSSSLSNSNPVSPIVRIGEQSLYDLGISVDRNPVSLSPSQTDNQTCGLNFSALPRLSEASSIIQQPIVRCPVSPVAISVSGSATLFLTGNNGGTISLYQKSSNNNNSNEQITQQVSPTSVNVHVNSRRPPLPRFESTCNKKGGHSVVRITALHNLRPTTTTPTKFSPSVRNRPELLRPSGSYDNLLCNGAVRRCSLTEQNFQRPKLRCFSVLTTNTSSSSSSNPSQRFFHSSSDHYVNAMPNAQSMGIEDIIKPNCSPQARLSTPTMINETSEQGSQDLRMLLNSRRPRNSVSSMRQQNMTPGGNKITTSNTSDQLRNIRSNVSGNNPNYFRIQIPSTRAISRPKGFAMTDSLKLYEEQIFSHCQPHQRPQSWCLDFDQPRDEHNPVDDSHSSSPASTVSSSFSSSSSSDTSQLLSSSHNHADLRRIRNPPYYSKCFHIDF
ncbi:unnamed protein product [Trichobilharzia szidati]|nr:unnamed protein product [Trichobilharzia szidati]